MTTQSNQPMEPKLSFAPRKNIGTLLRLGILSSLLALNSAQADVIISNTAPNTDVISNSPLGGTPTQLFPLTGTAPSPIAGNNNHARGQLFTLGNGSGFAISAITIQKNGTSTFSGDSLTLRIFEGSEADWNAGTGHTASDPDFYKDTSVTPLYEEIFTLNGTIPNGNFITFELNTPLVVSANSDFGFFMTYDPAAGSSPASLGHNESNNGGRISITTTNHGTSSRTVNYFVQGTPVSGVTSLSLGSPFQNRMILQRDKPVKVWGTATPDSNLQVVIGGNTINGLADAQGNWEVELPTFAAGGPYTLTATATSSLGSATSTVNDVLFGDVWLCFGQSNMRWRLQDLSGATTWDDSYRTDIAANDNIRCLRIDEDASLNEEETAGMSWLANSTVASWTAVGSVFAQQLHSATNVPVGIIYCAWGSSSIEGWMPRELENDFPHFAEMLSIYQRVDEFRAGTPTVSARATDGRLGTVFSSNEAAILSLTTNGWSSNDADIFIRTRPNIIYNRRIHPIRNYGISGFIWYQGEANSGDILNVAQYKFTLPRFVEEYRERFGQGDLPFLGVQLHSNNASLWHWFREAQDSLLTVPNGHITITADTGGSIHPSDKEEIGIRLALQARKYALGENIEADSPRYASHSINGNLVTLTFDHANGLTSNGTPATFEVAGADQIFHPATVAMISGNNIIVGSSSEPAPIAVRYAWLPVTHSQVNVFNGAGLPMAPFRTDSFPLPGLGAEIPFGVNDAYTALSNTTLSVSGDGVLTNDYDLNLDDLEADLLTTTSNGILSLQPNGSFTYTPNIGFTGTDSFTYRASEIAGNLNSPTATVAITVEQNPSGYEAWRATIAWLAGDDQTVSGDPDNDGIPNLLEYALNGNPLVSDPSILPTLTSLDAQNVSYDFDNAQPGISYQIETSTDLENWTPFTTLTNGSTTPVTIPLSQFSPANAKGGFVRLSVSESN